MRDKFDLVMDIVMAFAFSVAVLSMVALGVGLVVKMWLGCL